MRTDALQAFAQRQEDGDTLRLPGGTFTAAEETEIEVVRYRVVRDGAGREKARHRLSSTRMESPSKEHA